MATIEATEDKLLDVAAERYPDAHDFVRVSNDLPFTPGASPIAAIRVVLGGPVDEDGFVYQIIEED